MVPSEPAETPQAANASLRQALRTWLLFLGGIGLATQAWRFLPLPERSLLIVAEVFAILLLLLVARAAVRDPEACRWFHRPRPRAIEICVLLAAATWLLLSAWERQLPPSGVDYAARHREAGWPLWIGLLSSAVLPVLNEELLYRGLLQQRLRPFLGLGLAIALQAMLFAASHLDGWMLLPHFVFGVCCGVMREIAGGLWACVLFHAAWNAHCVLQSYGVL